MHVASSVVTPKVRVVGLPAAEPGEVVCILPESGITSTGDPNPFRPGVERIFTRTPVPVLPTKLRGL